MAIGTGSFKRSAAQGLAAKSIADRIAKEKKKEGMLGGLMSIMSPLAGMGSKALVHGLLGLGSGGILTPLLLGLGSAGIKGGAEKLARSSGMGADTGKIEEAATSKYGYGKKYAEETA